ncbi:hypothetical protein [Mumia zhuanghuii]|nr:hypothetical protein [Mumia zhuanghuii]
MYECYRQKSGDYYERSTHVSAFVPFVSMAAFERLMALAFRSWLRL